MNALARASGVLALLALLSAAAGAATSGAAEPALGWSAPEVFYVYAPGTGPGFDDQYVDTTVYVEHGRVLHDVVATVDASGLAGAVTWREESGQCTGDGAVLTCDLGSLDGGVDVGTFLAAAESDAEPGDEGVVRFHVTASDAPPIDRTLRVVVGRPELAVAKVRPPRLLRPGAGVDLPVVVTNRGNVPAEGFGVEVALGDQLTVRPDGGSRCHYLRSGRGAAGHGYCLFDRRLDPGDEVALTLPFHVVAGATLMYADAALIAFPGRTKTAFDQELAGSVPGTGPPVRLRAASGGAYPGGVGISTVRLDSGGHADFAAFGDSVRGKVGQTVTVEVGTRNLGPGVLDLTAKEGEAYRLEFVPPDGTTVVSNPFPGEDDPWTCAPGTAGAASYDCPPYLEAVPLHQRQTYVFRLRIDRAMPGPAGQVRVVPNDGRWSARDPDAANDVATVRVDVHGQVPQHEPEGQPIERGEDGSPARALWGVAGVLAGLAVLAGLVRWRRKVSRRGGSPG